MTKKHTTKEKIDKSDFIEILKPFFHQRTLSRKIKYRMEKIFGILSLVSRIHKELLQFIRKISEHQKNIRTSERLLENIKTCVD